MSFNDNQIQAPHPPFPVDHAHPWHKGSKVGSKEMDIAILSPNLAGSNAGFGEITASVDDTVGTPSVNATSSGSNAAKNIDFAFHNLKGEKGDKGDTFEFDDLTQAQLDELRSDIVGVSCKRYDLEYSDFSTSGSPVSTMYKDFGTNFDSSGDEDNFVFLVFKNGLLLIPIEEYGLDGGTGTFEGWKLSFATSEGHSLPTQNDIYSVVVIVLRQPAVSASLNMQRSIATPETNMFYGLTPPEVERSLSYRPTKDELRQACEWLDVEYDGTETNKQLREMIDQVAEEYEADESR